MVLRQSFRRNDESSKPCRSRLHANTVFRMKSLLLVLALIAAVAGIAAAVVRYATEPMTWHQTFEAAGCCVDITHAGGLLDGQPYTNSLEALNNSYRAGRRIFEVDLALTADDRIVLAHDWDAYGGAPPSSAEFLAGGELTRLDFAAFLIWVETACVHCLVVTDAKMDFRRFHQEYEASVQNDIKQRFVLQTYSFEEVHALAEKSAEQRQILTMYRMAEVSDADLVALSKVSGLMAVTMPMDRVPLQAASTGALSGKPVFTHGYPWMMQSELILRTARLFGVTGFYRD